MSRAQLGSTLACLFTALPKHSSTFQSGGGLLKLARSQSLSVGLLPLRPTQQSFYTNTDVERLFRLTNLANFFCMNTNVNGSGNEIL